MGYVELNNRMNDVDKIKQLFASQDINNHKLGYILAKNTLMMTDEYIIKLIVNDKGGYRLTEYTKYFTYDKTIFNYFINFSKWYSEVTNYCQVEGLVRMFTNKSSNLEAAEDVFYKQLTNNFTNLINEIFNDSSSSI